MSDEPTPPPLRLKPRVRPETPPAVAPAPADAALGAEMPKLRLKPKLAADVSAQSALTASPSSVPAPAKPLEEASPAAPAPDPPAIAQSDAASDGSADQPKFKLKTKVPGLAPSPSLEQSSVPPPSATSPAVSAAPSASPVSAELPRPHVPAPFPLIAEPPRGTKKFPPPAQLLRAAEPPKEETSAVSASAEPIRQAGGLGRGVSLAAVVLVLGAGVCGYFYFTAPEPEPPAIAQSSTIRSASPVPPTAPGSAVSLPGKAVEKARAATAADARRIGEQEPVIADAVPSAAGKPHPAVPPAAEPPPQAIVTTQIAPGVTASSASIDVTGNASVAFRTWVGAVRISGVFQGSPPRALVNGRTYRAGQVVDEPLGITLDAIDTAARTIRFRDRSGATGSRGY